jgi:hypothetical protein
MAEGQVVDFDSDTDPDPGVGVGEACPWQGTVDKRIRPSIRREKNAATRGERRNLCPKRT